MVCIKVMHICVIGKSHPHSPNSLQTFKDKSRLPFPVFFTGALSQLLAHPSSLADQTIASTAPGAHLLYSARLYRFNRHPPSVRQPVLCGFTFFVNLPWLSSPLLPTGILCYSKTF